MNLSKFSDPSLLSWLHFHNCRLHRVVKTFRQKNGIPKDSQLDSLCITDSYIDSMLDTFTNFSSTGFAQSLPSGNVRLTADETTAQNAYINQRDRGEPSRISLIKNAFGLSEVSLDALLICCTPEFDRSYDKVYAYLNDNMNDRFANFTLIASIIGIDPSSSNAVLQELISESPLYKFSLIEPVDDRINREPYLLRRGWRVVSSICAYLLGSGKPFLHKAHIASRYKNQDFVSTPLPNEVVRWIETEMAAHDKFRGIFFFHGTDRHTLLAAASMAARLYGKDLLHVDVSELLRDDVSEYRQNVMNLIRDARLSHSILLIDFSSDPADRCREVFSRLHETALEVDECIAVAAPDTRSLADKLHRCIVIAVQDFSEAERAVLWTEALKGSGLKGLQTIAADLAARFHLTPLQINEAARTALQAPKGDAATVRKTIHAACRRHSPGMVSGLARVMASADSWDDLILPEAQKELLLRLCNRVRTRSLVLDNWQLRQKTLDAPGTTALFSGPSGTGKTLAARIMAHALDVPVYRVDLSAVVSKYIGETEKNLFRIFDECSRTNAILFFDEADALFGTRTQVHDSHDRYANIEVSYLLQAIEDYDGMVILASNLKKNIDGAFLRRMQYVVEFPFPDTAGRRAIWARMYEGPVPCAKDVDFDDLANRFELTGGNIRNAALEAAFLAASDGKMVTRAHLIEAVRGEFLKMGKVLSREELEYSTKV